ncbi:hypothetical protein BJ875DRAFT_380978 [Amylocarpus encephaloides]|uniref:Uncharacterized protein n=1 Tax=Amylocarpus encephaloides TaxID=45428 RepID=A0A9P8C3A9_9HELO|nr:hypothetical protein BJ875DRAFT_380978 [Amylocarpus encephaloides]
MPPEEVNTDAHRQRMYEKRRGYFCIVVLCVLASTTAIILEAFAIFNIEYCDGEDLTQLYWGFWSILQVGSLIADLGVIFQFWIILSGAGTPPWAVALGTPVLVFAALGWVLKHQLHGVLNHARGRYMYGGDDADISDEEKAVDSASRWVSRA